MNQHPIIAVLDNERRQAEAPDGHPAGDGLGLLTNVAARLLARAFNERLQAHGATIGYWPVLRCLWIEDGPSQAELSRRIAIEAPTLTRTLERMERDGLVSRRRNPADRREIRVHLTPRGQELRAILLPEAAAIADAAVEGLSPAEVAELQRLLRHVVDRLMARGVTFDLDDVEGCCPTPDRKGKPR